jgi:hypothetical protein
MKRRELEHVLRAASQIVAQRDFLVIGSAAILGTYSDEVLPLEDLGHLSRFGPLGVR